MINDPILGSASFLLLSSSGLILITEYDELRTTDSEGDDGSCEPAGCYNHWLNVLAGLCLSEYVLKRTMHREG